MRLIWLALTPLWLHQAAESRPSGFAEPIPQPHGSIVETRGSDLGFGLGMARRGVSRGNPVTQKGINFFRGRFSRSASGARKNCKDDGYNRQAHARALGSGPYRTEEKRDKRTCVRKNRLGGTFPGTRIGQCPFISATNVSPNRQKLIATSDSCYRPSLARSSRSY
jgi:hypothetical protein